MHLISITNLRDDAAQYPDAERAIGNWFKTIEQAQWQNLEQVRQSFKDAEAVGNFTVFNIKGNDYRLITKIDSKNKIIFTVWIGTHSEYDKIQAKNIEYVKTNKN